MTPKEFLNNWGAKYWQYLVQTGNPHEENEAEMESDLDELLKERAVEYIKYCDKQDGIDWVEPSEYPEWYDTFIKEHHDNRKNS